ncbi:MFS general substrate transporter [Punctularia strigosozonata HHB-11173 SS5]|uniref:MFS general substrate transporter n=1 Tax=Punctularia strigosozonata (strain HHB-11173) TaxID=741275 RepID=UPI000441869D|nr:MFS general substrate transporter [Punctularia strigosozonata HHB-11173 SS5]EIN07877.1 MFS general substrate transporter [Punctularia strigosozonata HHB-11173 SS5]
MSQRRTDGAVSGEKDGSMTPRHSADAADEAPTRSCSPPAKADEAPYSIFTTREKWTIVALTSYAALFSPLTANIYFPAIPTLAKAFHTSTENINVTVTVYMVMQGVAPMIWGTLADRWGRRPMFLGCMLLLCLSCVGLALVPTNAYWLLVVLRLVQAGGSASTVALAAGVVSDIATAAERGGFFGISGLGSLLGPCIGPVIGGALTQHFGWRAIFWFLCIASGVSLIFFAAVLPETLRSIVGNGSIPPPRIYKTPVTLIGGRYAPDAVKLPPGKRFVNPFRLFLYPDLDVLLVFFGLIYAVFYGVTATLSSLFADAYPFLDETDLGLLFLAIGGGMIVGTGTMGKILDWEYRRIRDGLVRKYVADGGEKVDVAEAEAEVTKEENFPIEKARLRLIPILLTIYVACLLGYGWCLQEQVSIAVPLILQFIIGYVCTAIMNDISTLMLDLTPGRGSSVTACNNLVRCSLGAIAVSIMDPILKALRPGWTYVLLAGICVVASPALWVVLRWGPMWRAKRRAQLQSNSQTQ